VTCTNDERNSDQPERTHEAPRSSEGPIGGNGIRSEIAGEGKEGRGAREREGLTPRIGSSGACARPAKTEHPCDAMVGDDSRVAELPSDAVLRGEEGSRWRTSVFNRLRSSLGLLLAWCVTPARELMLWRAARVAEEPLSFPARGTAGGSSERGRGKKKSWARPGCGRRIAHKTAGAAVFPVPWRRVGAQKNYSLALLRALVVVRCRAGTEWSAAEGDHTIFCIRVLVCRFHASKGCVATCWLLPTLRDAGQMIQGPSKRPERCAAAGSGEEAATGPGATVHVTLSVIWTAFLRVHKKTFSYGT
jgi:hypothetical protein